MKKVIPFSKTVSFKTMLTEITDIEIKHTLELKNDSEVEGDILIDGKYKMTEASTLLEDFHFRFPFMIAIDSKYKLDDLNISISNFNYEIVNEEELKLDIEIELDGLEEVDNTKVFEQERIEIKEEQEEIDNNIESVFNTTTSKEEKYSTYYVYIVMENDTIEKILDKYKITKESLEQYNDISNIKVGDKLIIPCRND